MVSQRQVFTTGEVASFCNVKKMTVVRWVDRGELRAHQLPGRGDRRITRDDLLAFMQANGFPIPDELTSTNTDILVIDDDLNMAKAIQRTLVAAGYEVKIATNGFLAGSMIETLKPQMITLDLAMPGMSGLEILQYIRKKKNLRNMKILVISALPRERLDEALEAGADSILPKPFENNELLTLIQTALGRTLP